MKLESMKGREELKTYLRHRIWNVVEVKELIALEYLDFSGKYKDYSEHHDFWELCFVERGEVSLFVDADSISLKEGELFLISPDRIHSYNSCKGSDAKAFVVCFASSSVALKAVGNRRFFSDETFQRCMRQIIEEGYGTFKMNEEEHLEVLEEPNFGGQQAILLQLEYLLILLLRKLSLEKNSMVVFLDGETFYSDLSKIVLRFFEEHVRENLSLDDVCKKMNYSRSFLCKTFKKQTGETLMGSFNRMRMREAAKLLEQTNESVTSVALYFGFSEVKYFGALFKRYMGVSPTEYRKNLAKRQGRSL